MKATVAMMRASTLRHHPRRQRRQQHRDDAGGRRHQPRPGGGVADLGLQPQRHQQIAGEEHGIAQAEGQRAQREIAALEQRQVDDRDVSRSAPRSGRRRSRPPATIARITIWVEANQSASLPCVQHHLQRADPDHQQPQAHRVDGQLAGGGLAVLQVAPAQEGHDQAHRHIDQENPAPVIIVARYSRPGWGRRSAPPAW